MKWTFKCPLCAQEHTADWEHRDQYATCETRGLGYKIPTPFNDHHAYVDDRDPPKEMRDAVTQTRGPSCFIAQMAPKQSKNCKGEPHLDHLVPWTENETGTRVSNLAWMCEHHNTQKGGRDIVVHLRELGIEADVGL